MKKPNKAALGLLFLCLLGCSSGGTESGGQSDLWHPKIDEALAIINTDAKLAAEVLKYPIRLYEEKPAGAVCAAPYDHIAIWLDYVNRASVAEIIACVCHEFLHLREGHQGQSPDNEAEANAYASYCLNRLGINI